MRGLPSYPETGPPRFLLARHDLFNRARPRSRKSNHRVCPVAVIKRRGPTLRRPESRWTRFLTSISNRRRICAGGAEAIAFMRRMRRLVSIVTLPLLSLGRGINARGLCVEHRADIDGLRGVAVSSVVLYHFGTGLVSGGFAGVDIFFVISGFVISRSLLADLEADRFSIGQFYVRRIRRIFPAFAALIVVSFMAAVVILLPSDLVDYGRSVVSTNLFVSNIYFWKSSGYFAASAQTTPLLHTWSLAVEEQFYVFAPLLLALIYRFGGKRWIIWLAPPMLLSFAASVAAVFVGPTAGFFLLPTRAWELLLGAIIALVNRPVSRSLWVGEAMAICGALLIAFGLLTLHDTDPFPGWNALFPCIGTALVIQAAIGRDGALGIPWATRLLAIRPLVWIGLISYSLYLVHWPIAAFVRYLSLRGPTALEAVLMAGASLALAWLSWRWIEQPFRRPRAGDRWRVLSAGAATMAAGIIVGAVGIAAGGFPGRFAGLVEQRISGVEDWGGDQCFNQDSAKATPWSATDCTRIHGNRGRIIVWGDSFAAQYMPGILRDAKRINADVLQYTFAGCPPILAYFSYARAGCLPFNERLLSIIPEQHIDTVVMAARWTATPLRTIDRLGETIAKLKTLGTRIYVFGPSPEFASDVQHIDYLSGQYKQAGAVSWSVSFDPSLNDRVLRQSSEAVYVDPLAYLCSERRCVYREGQNFYYADYGHFSTSGSSRAVSAYFPSGNAVSGAHL
jgi:peptidoglycan/LPS O-acetylase OafA/YrhL